MSVAGPMTTPSAEKEGRNQRYTESTSSCPREHHSKTYKFVPHIFVAALKYICGVSTASPHIIVTADASLGDAFGVTPIVKSLSAAENVYIFPAAVPGPSSIAERLPVALLLASRTQASYQALGSRPLCMTQIWHMLFSNSGSERE